MKPRRRARRWVLLAAAVILLAAVGAFVVAWRNSGSRPVSLDEARKRLGTTAAAGTTTAAGPAAGVYEYRGSGTERLDKPPKSQAQGPVIPGTVTREARGCWTFRADYSTGHWQSRKYCPRPGGGVTVAEGQTHSEWDFVFAKVDSTTTLACSAGDLIRPGMRPGDTSPLVCSGTTTAVKGETKVDDTTTYLGPDHVTVGGVVVPAYHFRTEGRIGGSQSGTEFDELWLAQDTALPLRDDRRNEVRSDSPIGTVTYTERGTFMLESSTPR